MLLVPFEHVSDVMDVGQAANRLVEHRVEDGDLDDLRLCVLLVPVRSLDQVDTRQSIFLLFPDSQVFSFDLVPGDDLVQAHRTHLVNFHARSHRLIVVKNLAVFEDSSIAGMLSLHFLGTNGLIVFRAEKVSGGLSFIFLLLLSKLLLDHVAPEKLCGLEVAEECSRRSRLSRSRRDQDFVGHAVEERAELILLESADFDLQEQVRLGAMVCVEYRLEHEPE